METNSLYRKKKESRNKNFSEECSFTIKIVKNGYKDIKILSKRIFPNRIVSKDAHFYTFQTQSINTLHKPWAKTPGEKNLKKKKSTRGRMRHKYTYTEFIQT